MKFKIILTFVLLASAFSCKKDSNGGPLIGKWRTTQIFYMNYMAESPYIQFSSQGRVQSTYFSKCTGYSVKGNDLTLKYTGSPDITQANYTYSIKNDTLSLYPVNGPESDNGTGVDLTFVKE